MGTACSVREIKKVNTRVKWMRNIRCRDKGFDLMKSLLLKKKKQWIQCDTIQIQEILSHYKFSGCPSILLFLLTDKSPTFTSIATSQRFFSLELRSSPVFFRYSFSMHGALGKLNCSGIAVDFDGLNESLVA